MERIISFIKELERLKDTYRNSWTSSGRRESVAEHSFRTAFFVFLLGKYFSDIDIRKAISIALVHDLGEIYDGDKAAIEDIDEGKKHSVELESVERVASILDPENKNVMIGLWKEYDAGISKEARLVKAIDKMETIIQHNQGENPFGTIKYSFNPDYGKKYTESDVLLKKIREVVDIDTKKRVEEEKQKKID